MATIRIKVKSLDYRAVFPTYSYPGDACVNLVATGKSHDGANWVYNTGLAIEIPEGYVGLLFPRSSVSKTKMLMRNCVGVIDSGYRGEIVVKMASLDIGELTDAGLPCYNVGEKVAQLMVLPVPTMEFERVDKLSESLRGEGGFGSSGK